MVHLQQLQVVVVVEGDVREIEGRENSGAQTRQALLDALDELETRVGRVVVPLSHADELYALRNHIEMVRRKLVRT